MNRILKVVRLQLIQKMTFVWIPLIVVGGSLLVSILIWAMIPPGGVKYSGGGQAIVWYFVAIGVQALTLTFPFSQALSITRRDFVLGTLLMAVIASAAIATLFTVGALVETATGGWGVNGTFFRFGWLWEQGWWAAWLAYFAAPFLLFTIGFASAAIFKRWGTVAVVATGIGLALLGVGAMWLIGALDAWPSVLETLAGVTAASLALLGVLAAAVLSISPYAIMRRAVP